MDRLGTTRNLFPVLWVGLGMAVLVADFLSGPFVSLTILFIIPVMLAARFSNAWWGMALGTLMPIAHLGFTVLWPAPWSLEDSILNAALRIGVLVGFAYLIGRVTRQSRELRVLRGLLPICGFCKKIRTEDQQWLPIERFITDRSEATFTHGFCPECGKKHYGEYFDKLTTPQAKSGETTPNAQELNGPLI